MQDSKAQRIVTNLIKAQDGEESRSYKALYGNKIDTDILSDESFMPSRQAAGVDYPSPQQQTMNEKHDEDSASSELLSTCLDLCCKALKEVDSLHAIQSISSIEREQVTVTYI